MKPVWVRGSYDVWTFICHWNPGKGPHLGNKYHPKMCFLPSSKLTWQWKMHIFNREYIFNRSIFHYHVIDATLPEGRFSPLPVMCKLSPPSTALVSKCRGHELLSNSHRIQWGVFHSLNRIKRNNFFNKKMGWPWKIHPLLSFRLLDATPNTKHQVFNGRFFALFVSFWEYNWWQLCGTNNCHQIHRRFFSGVQRRSSEIIGTNWIHEIFVNRYISKAW